MTGSGHAAPAVVVAVTSATTVLAGLAVFSRLITRLVVVKKSGTDDICIVVAMVLSIALTVTMCEEVKYGMGRHFVTLTNNDKLHLMQWFWASVWIYYSSLCFTKISILLQYLRVFPSEGFRKACYILMGVIVAYSIATFLTSVFACVPVQSFWDPTPKMTCVDLKAVWFTNASINIVTDICTGVLPIRALSTLTLPKRQKYALMAVFALGGFTCIISILRLQSLYVVSVSNDITWDNPLPAIWSSTEVNVGIICSCLPTLKGCVARFFPRIFPTNSNRYPSFRETGHTGRSQSQLRQSAFTTKAIELPLSPADKPKLKNQVSMSEDEDSLREIDNYHGQSDAVDDRPRTINYSWLQDPSSKEDVESEGSDSVRHPSKAMSSHQVV